MPRYFPIKRVLGMLASILVGAVSLAPTIQQPVTGFIYKVLPSLSRDINWLGIISLIVLFILVVSALWDLSKRIQKLEDFRPIIDEIKEVEENNNYFLQIRNIGNTGEFTAQMEVLEDTGKRHAGKTLVGYWVLDKRHNRSLIDRNQIDKIRVIHLEENGNIKGIHLDYYDPQSDKLSSLSTVWAEDKVKQSYLKDGSPTSIMSILWVTSPPRYKLRVTISYRDLSTSAAGASTVKEYQYDAQKLYENKRGKIANLLNYLDLLSRQQR